MEIKKKTWGDDGELKSTDGDDGARIEMSELNSMTMRYGARGATKNKIARARSRSRREAPMNAGE